MKLKEFIEKVVGNNQAVVVYVLYGKANYDLDLGSEKYSFKGKDIIGLPDDILEREVSFFMDYEAVIEIIVKH